MPRHQYATISKARLSSERNRLIYAALIASAATSVVLSLLVVLVQREVVGWERCIAWLAIVIVVQAMRLWTLGTYRRAMTAADARSEYHEKRFILGAAAAGGAWGLASVLLYAPDPTHQVFLAFVVAGVSAGAVSTLGACPSAATWFLSLALAPLMVRLVSTGGLMPLTMALMTALFLAFLIMSSRRISATLDENSMLRFYEEETQAQLSAAMGMKQAVMDAANYAIVATDTAGMVHTFNQGSSRMLGYDAAEVVNHRTLTSFYDEAELRAYAHDSGADAPGGALEALISNARAGTEEREWTWVRRDGSRLPVLVSLSPVRDADDNLTGFVAVAADITERRRVDALKDQFVSTVSHELRTPLTSIRGSIGLLASGAAGAMPDRAQRMLDVAARNSERLVLLINDLLDIEKIEAGQMEFDIRTQPVMPLVQQAVEGTQPYAREYGTHYEILGDADVVAGVEGQRLVQVLMNLLSNAAKFSDRDALVTITVTRAASGVGIAVTDQGAGIPPSFLPRLFDKFSQADSSDQRRKGGTGLGLAISRAIMEQMHGTITVTSVVGEGSTFTVEVPAAMEQA